MPQNPEPDFETSDIDWRPEWIAEVWQEHPALYRNHLLIARHLEGMAERHVENSSILQPKTEEQKTTQFAEGLLWVVAFLRQGDYVPGGRLYGSK
jgi:hypothetical protein